MTPLIYIVSDQTTTTYLKVASPHRTRGDANLFQAPIVQMVYNAIKWIYLYPVHKAIVFPNIYSLDSDLCGG